MTYPPARLALPSPGRAAFLLDFDGTLVDIAPTPEQVVVPAGLADALARLRDRVGGALAIVTGRPIAQIDALLPDIPYAVAGEHGGASRHAPGAAVHVPPLPELLDGWREASEAIAASHPGTLLESKRHGFVLHYRTAPQHGTALHEVLSALIAPADGRFRMLGAKMAWEIRPDGIDKGGAVRALMAHPPFAGRLPVFVGDDVTDEDGIAAAVALGGVGLRVPEAFGEPTDVRAWIARLAAANPAEDRWDG